MPLLPWIDPENFNPGYMMRAMHLLPKRGDKPEWQHNQDYWSEKDQFPAIDLATRPSFTNDCSCFPSPLRRDGPLRWWCRRQGPRHPLAPDQNAQYSLAGRLPTAAFACYLSTDIFLRSISAKSIS